MTTNKIKDWMYLDAVRNNSNLIDANLLANRVFVYLVGDWTNFDKFVLKRG